MPRGDDHHRKRARGGEGGVATAGGENDDVDEKEEEEGKREDEDGDGEGEGTDDGALIHSRLPAYLAEAFGELYGEDGLVVLGRGMGLLPLLASFVRFVADPGHGHVSVVRDQEEEEEGRGPRRHRGGANGGGGDAGAAGPSGALDGDRPPLVFVLGLREAERGAVVSLLQNWGTPPALLPTLVTNESGQGKDRSVMYRRGGVFIITSRILIVDLLTNVASSRDIEGMLVAHAENVTEQSTEAFILRIYRTQRAYWAANRHTRASTLATPGQSSSGGGGGGGGGGGCLGGPTVTSAAGFIKAFTDDPAALMAGFAKVDKILKALNVRRLYLYPRFHSSVADELERCQPTVEELHQELTPLMKEIQGAIAAAVQTCIRELKKSTTLIEWTDPDITLENCVTKNFDMAISRQLDQDWHRLRPQTKQLVSDLRTLRTLFQYLVHYDCVSFWKLIQNIKTMSAASRYPSMWLLTPAGEMLFRKAKERIYRIFIPKPTSRQPNPIGVLHPVLEENPKWRLLSKILTEIKSDWATKKKKEPEGTDNPDPALSFEGGARVLVMVKDERTLETLKSYLVDGKERTMTLRWLRYLENYNEISRNITRGSGGTSGISEETRLLLEEEGRARNLLFGASGATDHAIGEQPLTIGKGSKRKPANVAPDWMKKKRKISAERNRGHKTLQEDDLERRAVLDEALAETEKDLDDAKGSVRHPSETDDIEHCSYQDDRFPPSSDDEEELAFKVRKLDEFRVVLRTYSSAEGEEALLLLEDLRPSYVVLYDADPSFIRSIELHSNSMLSDDVGAISPLDRLRVYFMLFEASSEERNFLKSLEREQNAFERLIQHKKTMPLPVNTLDGITQEMQQSMGGVAGSYANGSLPLSMDTRTGRGKQRTGKDRGDIAVDVREFRSSLPSILHQGGMRIAPVTLTVGDFVLSPVHCIERKSISDLFGSFASGRLFTQAESMTKYYKCPCLLIEFDPSKSFCLQSPNDLGGDIRTDSVCSKMSLLVMHFPKLRLLWSREPHETLKVFKALKMNHEEVDVDKAVEIGSNESLDEILGINSSATIGGNIENGVEENEVNEAARDLLLRLPGINVNNARKVMTACDSIADLAEMPRDELKKLLGPITGQKLFTFLRQQLAAT